MTGPEDFPEDSSSESKRGLYSVSDVEGSESPNVRDIRSPRGGVITARGTGDGVVLRLDARVEEQDLKSALLDFMESRKGFLSGNGVSLEWVGAKPAESFVDEISLLLQKQFGISVREGSEGAPSDSKSTSLLSQVERVKGEPATSLFDGVEAIEMNDDLSSGFGELGIGSATGSSVGEGSAVWDDPDARIVFSTLRSGQKVETEHSLVVCGDVNSGAEVVAGGDVIVLGTLRGVAHAGAYDETGGGRFIFALNLQASQLRVGSVISRGGTEGGTNSVAEIAHVEGDLIVVEPYQSRSSIVRKIR